MRVLMTGGGTAGHINPALAIAADIRRRVPDAEFLFVGATGRMATELVPKAGYPLKTITVKGFSRRLTPAGIAHNVSAAWYALAAGGACKKILKEFQPDIAIGTGGYVCGPILRTAAKMGIPVVVHESNALPGVTVKMLAKYATAICLPTEESKSRMPADSCPLAVTGNPLRAEFLSVDKAAARKALGVDDRPLVLSFGGSLGARRLNEAMTDVLVQSAKSGRCQHIHGTGKNGYDEMMAALAARGVTGKEDGLSIRPYIDNIVDCMAAADLVICRCGAMTISELPACGAASVLIPSPYVAENHQFHNAMVLVNKGAAVCIEEKDLTGETLAATVEELLADPDKLRRMSEAAREGAILDASDRIWAIIESALKK